MLYSNACEYAIRALTFLAKEPGDGLVLRSTIAEASALPGPFLGKILNDLVRAGLLESVRGRGGGYRLARPATDISLLDVKLAIDGLADLDACAVGLDPCSDETPCPLHEDYKRVRTVIREYLASTRLSDLVEGARKKGALLGR